MVFAASQALAEANAALDSKELNAVDRATLIHLYQSLATPPRCWKPRKFETLIAAPNRRISLEKSAGGKWIVDGIPLNVEAAVTHLLVEFEPDSMSIGDTSCTTRMAWVYRRTH